MLNGSETIAIYYFIENIECRVIQCHSFKFPEKEDKKRNVCGVLMYQLMLLINSVNIVTYVFIKYIFDIST